MWILKMLLSPLFFFMKWLAEENVLFTACKEGTVKAVMASDSFDHFIMSSAGYHLNDPRKKGGKAKLYIENITVKSTGGDGKETQTVIEIPDWEVLYHGKGNTLGFTEFEDSYYDERGWILKHLGLYWIGWPWSHNVYVYQFEWNETITNETSGEEEILPLSNPSDFIFVKDFVYAIKTVGAETRDRLTTDELTFVTIAIRNPYRALFSGEDWLLRTTADINRHVRNFIGSRNYAELISPVEDDDDSSSGGKSNGSELGTTESREKSAKLQRYWAQFSDPIIELNEHLPDDKPGRKPFGLQGRYGVEIRGAALQTIDLSGERKEELEKAATKIYVARQEAKAIRLTADATGYSIQVTGTREAEALASRLAIIKANGDAGMLLAQLDAIQAAKGAGSQVIWANNPFAPITGLLKPEVKGGETS